MSTCDTPSLPATDALRQLHLEDQRRARTEHLARLRWSTTRLQAEQRDRLRALITVASTRSSWHRERLNGIDPEGMEVHDLRQLPTMTKQQVMENFDAIVTEPRLSLHRVETHLASLGTEPNYLLERYQPVVSGGSSGVRGVFVYDWDAWTACFAAGYRYLHRDLRRQPLTMAVIAAGNAAHISRAILQTFSDPRSLSIDPLPITLPIDRILAALNERNPETILVYPSGLIELVQAARDGRLRISPQAIITGGEPLDPQLRTAAEETFDTTVLNWWLTTEAGPMAIGCGHGPWMHLSEDLMILEPVDENNHAVAPGVRSSKVLVTVLYNHALPLIRYELDDEVTLLDHDCTCGSQHRLITDVQGRHDEVFSYAGITVHPHVFRTVLSRQPGIVEYRVKQTPNGAEIEYRGRIDHAAVTSQLTTALRALDIPDPTITLTNVNGFDRQQTGKVRRFIPLPGIIGRVDTTA
jgi:phenylacetate-coenzyme A ligase PaaK-like adenylate-forming protein